MAGYSGTPLSKKLGIKEGSRVGLFEAPDGVVSGRPGSPPADGFDAILGDLPDGVTKTTRLGGALDMAVFFTTSRSALERRFAALAKAVAPAGSLWISWPKKSSGKKTDLDDNVVRAVGLANGLVDVKVCAIDETWSGLKFVVRLKDRPSK